MRGFIEFIRKQGVIGLAVGFILGGAVSKVVTAIVDDLINPLISLIFGSAKSLASSSVTVHGAQFKWGDFVSVIVNLIIIAAVVYFGVKGLRIDRLDKKDEPFPPKL